LMQRVSSSLITKKQEMLKNQTPNLGNHRKRYDQTCILVFMQNTLYSCQILMELQFSWHNFEKY
jgi:hypothetical protein